MACEAVDVCDSEPAFSHIYEQLGHHPSECHVGKSGDILSRMPARLDADAVVVGPPCPPFSTAGLRRHGQDSRSRVFRRALEWIVSAMCEHEECFTRSLGAPPIGRLACKRT